ncbi:MAG: hypothetical protein KAQ83_03480, partial [Nanoarchaeota archaeon]|nr:hypothetical protein [Nanoarchaeota archaeon]
MVKEETKKEIVEPSEVVEAPSKKVVKESTEVKGLKVSEAPKKEEPVSKEEEVIPKTEDITKTVEENSKVEEVKVSEYKKEEPASVEKKLSVEEIKSALNAVDSEKEKWFKEKEEANNEVADLIKKIKKVKIERDALTKQVHLSKEERKKLNQEIKE